MDAPWPRPPWDRLRHETREMNGRDEGSLPTLSNDPRRNPPRESLLPVFTEDPGNLSLRKLGEFLGHGLPGSPTIHSHV